MADTKTNILKDLTGARFDKLTVISRANTNSKSGNAMWVCRCECGSITEVIGSKLRSGYTKSCGCLRISDTAQGYSKERVYRTWRGMHQRCYNQKHDKYKWYGGRGITICPEWHDFITFRIWALENGYSDDLTIDRIDPDDNYCPDNCQWVDMKTQANNRSNNRILYFNGKAYTVSQIAEMFGISSFTIFNRLRLKWSVEQIVRTPERSTNQNGAE